MKQILSLVIIAAVISFINAQGPPTPYFACTSYMNSTAAAFCSATGYLISNTTDYATVNTLATSRYNTIINQITNPSVACQTAVRAMTCQSAIPRCTIRSAIVNIAQARCDAVTTACNITGFPGNYTTVTCVRNTLASIDGQPVVCVPRTYTTLGSACVGNIFDPTIATPATVQTVVCPAVSACNTTGADNVCRRPSSLNQACTANTQCQSITGLPLGVGATLECLGGKCQHRNKRFNAPCTVNEECRSNNCTSGVCLESGNGGFCLGTNQCRDNLWCDIRNSTCYAVALNGEPCGIVQSNWSPVPCTFGFSCVRQNASSPLGFSTCVANANIGQACSVATGAVAYDNALCDPSTIPTTGVAECRNNICTVVTGAPQDAVCNSTITCAPTLTCKYPTQTSTQGTCAAPNTVACDAFSASCNNAFQRCQCGTDLGQPGTCVLDNARPDIQCAAQGVALTQCIKTTCRSNSAANFVPYDGSSCAALQCLNQVNAYMCCVKNTVGANYVAPDNQPADPCVTPTTPAPTGPTPSPSTPTPTPSRSGAANVAISFVAVIVAIVAFCL